jgi:hypothetical protein
MVSGSASTPAHSPSIESSTVDFFKREFHFDSPIPFPYRPGDLSLRGFGRF